MAKAFELTVTKIAGSQTISVSYTVEGVGTIEDLINFPASPLTLMECFRRADEINFDVEKKSIGFLFRRGQRSKSNVDAAASAASTEASTKAT